MSCESRVLPCFARPFATHVNPYNTADNTSPSCDQKIENMTATATQPNLDAFPEGFGAVVVGASGGIGAAMVAQLLGHPRCGRVFALCRDPDRSSFDPDVEVIAADVTDESSLRNAANTIQALATGVHLVVSTVGILHTDVMHPERSLDQVEPASIARAFETNATGTALVAKHFVPLMQHEQHCVLAFLSARVGSIGDNRLGGWYSYRASKAAQNQLIRTMAIEFKRRRGPICVALHPGTVDTGLSEPFQANVPEHKLHTPARCANDLLSVIDTLGSKDTGQFFAWDGQAIPW